MEGIRFRETPEQARRNQQANIDAKIRRCEILSDSDYEFLREREQAAIDDLVAKIAAEMSQQQ